MTDARPVRVLVNALHALSGGGVTYLRNLLPALAEDPGLAVVLCLHEAQRPAFADLPAEIAVHVVRFPDGFLCRLVWEQLALPVVARRLGAEVTFSPANMGPWLAPRPVILLRNALAVGDEDRRPAKRLYWAALAAATRLSLATSRRAIAVSAYARDTLAPAAARGRIEVIHHGVDPLFSPPADGAVREDFLLVVGDLYVQKNLHRLVEAVAKVRRTHARVSVRVAGAPVDPDYARRLAADIRRLGLGDTVTLLGPVAPADLAGLYRRCRALVFPSTVETFGNPLVEAMASATPIVASDSAAMPEVLGDAALLFDPRDVAAMARAIAAVLDDDALCRDLSERARNRARLFSWGETTARTANVLKAAASERRGGPAHLLRYAATLAPGAAIDAARRHLVRRLAAATAAPAARRRDPFLPPAEDSGLAERVPTLAREHLAAHAEAVLGVAALYLDHRFDVLGTGWARIEHGMACRGFAGTAYPPAPAADADSLTARLPPGAHARAGRIRALIGPGYRPIDWHIDAVSGYRWREDTWHAAVAYGHRPGVDVKLPWELARLQHLPQLAMAALVAPPEPYRRAFRNQTLDFLAANPPGFGVNWAATMEVAIRLANLCLAFDLFRRHGARFDAPFLAELGAAVRAHGRHAAGHLDWHPRRRGNHYLADVVGLLFAAAYLPADAETDAWLAFAVRALVAEVERQFGPDGGHFEASTAYHRLAMDLVVHATALVMGLPAPRRAGAFGTGFARWRGGPPPPPPLAGGRFPEWYGLRLARMARFMRDVTKPSGRLHQVGDNDSGRLFRLAPRRRRLGIAEARATDRDEDGLDTGAVAAAAEGLFEPADPSAPVAAETALVAGLAGGGRFDRSAASAAPADRCAGAVGGPPPGGREVIVPLADPGVLAGLGAAAYPDFGLFLWRSPRLYLAVRAGRFGRDGTGAHAHNDALAVELEIDGVDWLADPGSFCYTPSPALRDAYRSVAAHAAPRRGTDEPSPLNQGLFRLADRARATCLAFDVSGFVGRHEGFGSPVVRHVAIGSDHLRIVDFGASAAARIVADSPAALRRALGEGPPFSPGYGRRLVAGRKP